jgi:hypothetical protein
MGINGIGLLADRVLWNTYNYVDKWFIWKPEDGAPSAATVTTVTQTYADSGSQISAIDCAFKPSGNRAVANELNAGDFHYRIAVLTLTYEVTTLDATEITSTSAKLNGYVNAPCVARGFDWGTQSGVYTNEWYEEGNFLSGNFSHTITGLTPNQRYYFRAKAKWV